MLSTPQAKFRQPSVADEPAVCNVARYLPLMARSAPDRPAVIVTASIDGSGRATYRHVSFAELDALSNRYANGLRLAGIERGQRTLVMVRPGVDFVAIIFALFKLGAVPVMIDPGMGVSRLLDCVRQVDLHAFVGIPLAHVLRVLKPAPFRSVRTIITVGCRWLWGGATLDELSRQASDRFEMEPTRANDEAAILFTSGSTGPAKGVVYEHGMFDAQIRLIRDHYGIEPGEVDLPAFPLFVLFSTAMGMTAVIPDMDPSRPARVDPTNIVRAIHDHNVTNTFGSPAIWTRVANYCAERRVKLPSIRRILIAGAPVPWSVIQTLHAALDSNADVHTPYGATESLPVSSIAGRDLLDDHSELAERTRRGAGTCVGRVLPEIDLRFIRISDDPIHRWSDDLLIPDGEIGEMVVSGPVVTKEYFGLPDATARSKIHDGSRVWHRMGDVGYRDADGRIWFFGRKAHRVCTERETLYTDQCEPVFNEHLRVFRTALVGVPNGDHQLPVIVVELHNGRMPRGKESERIRNELRAIGREVESTASIEYFLFHRSLPVDVRHNAKINREMLADWAARRMR